VRGQVLVGREILEVSTPGGQVGPGVGGRPNVWIFQSPLSPSEIAERLTHNVGRIGETTAKPIIGKVGAAEARLYQRPTSPRSTPTPLRMEWTADGVGSAVKCRMPPRRDTRTFFKVWRIAALLPLLTVPGLIGTIAKGGYPPFGGGLGLLWFKLFGALAFAGVACALPNLLRWGLAQERIALLNYATEWLDAGPIRAARE
jgi:hypothetical protein